MVTERAEQRRRNGRKRSIRSYCFRGRRLVAERRFHGDRVSRTKALERKKAVDKILLFSRTRKLVAECRRSFVKLQSCEDKEGCELSEDVALIISGERDIVSIWNPELLFQYQESALAHFKISPMEVVSCAMWSPHLCHYHTSTLPGYCVLHALVMFPSRFYPVC